MNEKITPMPDCSFCRDEGDVCCFCRAEAYPALTARVKELEEALREAQALLRSGKDVMSAVMDDQQRSEATQAMAKIRAALNKEPT